MKDTTTDKPLLKKATVHERTVKKAASHVTPNAMPRTRGKDRRLRNRVVHIVPMKMVREAALKLAEGDKRRLQTINETTIVVRNPIYKD